MKVKFLRFYAAAAFLSLLCSCSNDDDTLPGQGGGPSKSQLKISFSSPFPEQGSELSPGYVMLTLVDQNEEEIFSDKKVEVVSAANGFVTGPLELSAGEYQLAGFVVYNNADEVIFATPFAGSPKASGLTAVLPLSVAVTLSQPAVADAEVAMVVSPEEAGVFGYEAGEFGELPEEPDYQQVSFSASVMVGDFLYDNLNSAILITATDDDGDSWTVGRDLDGITVITLPTTYDYYYVQWTQWGQVYQQELDKEQLFSDKTVTLEATREVRKLKSETEYILLAEGSRLESKTEYIYNVDGRLSRRDFYYFDHEKQEFILQVINWFEYQNGRLHTMMRTVGGTLLDTQEYFYKSNGDLEKIVQTGLNGTQEATWLYDDPANVFKGIRYSFDNGLYFTYNYVFEDGNIVHEYSGEGNTAGASSSQKQYDSFINPHYLLGITDYFLRNSSKNNVNGATHNYVGSFPVYVPSQYAYTYESGYPTERQVKYTGYQNASAGYTSKTVFEY